MPKVFILHTFDMAPVHVYKIYTYHAVTYIYLGCLTIRKPIKNHDFSEVIKKINTRLQFLYSLGGKIDFCLLNHFVDFSVMQKYDLILTMLGLMAFYSNSHNSKV